MTRPLKWAFTVALTVAVWLLVVGSAVGWDWRRVLRIAGVGVLVLLAACITEPIVECRHYTIHVDTLAWQVDSVTYTTDGWSGAPDCDDGIDYSAEKLEMIGRATVRVAP